MINVQRGNVTNMARKGDVTELPVEKSRFPTPSTKVGNRGRDRAKTALGGPATDRRASFSASRDGSEQFGSGTHAHSQI